MQVSAPLPEPAGFLPERRPRLGTVLPIGEGRSVASEGRHLLDTESWVAEWCRKLSCILNFGRRRETRNEEKHWRDLT